MAELFLGVKPSNGANHMVEDTAHLITMAPSGSGKGTALLVPNLLLWPNSAFVLDPKGELTWLTAEHRAKPVSEGGLGQKVYVLDPYREVERSWRSRLPAVYTNQLATHAVNPLDSLSFEAADPISGGDDYHDDLSSFMDALIEHGGEREPFWKQSAAQLLRGVITAGLMDGKRSLSQVRERVCSGYEELHDDVVYPVTRGQASYARRQLGRFTIAGRVLGPNAANPGVLSVEKDGSSVSKEMQSVHSTAIEETNFLDSPRLLRSLEGSDDHGISKFSMRELAASHEKVTVYVVLPPDKFESAFSRKWLRLVLQSALNEVMRARPKEKVLFALDEFGTIGRLGQIESAFGVARGQGLCLWAFLQNLGQLKRDYEKNYQTFMANASAATFFNLNDPETAGFATSLIGKSYKEKPASRTIGEQGQTSETVNVELTDIARSDEVMRFGRDKMIVIERGKPPFWITARHYHAYAPWLSLCRQHPDHLEAAAGPLSSLQSRTAKPKRWFS